MGNIHKKLTQFISKEGFNLQILSPGLLKLLIEQNLILQPTDFFKLSNKMDALNKILQNINIKLTAQDIIQEINNRRHITCANFIYSLAMEDITYQDAKLLANHYKSFAQLRKEIEHTISIIGLSFIKIATIKEFITNPRHKIKLDELCDFIQII